mmetsp:Transcript_31960/g.48191  ORF Transcript_31960/g.48191 Transcript_31960/m.48191 type:complete len:266 (+) Transcript_31960:2-799(+)
MEWKFDMFGRLGFVGVGVNKTDVRLIRDGNRVGLCELANGRVRTYAALRKSKLCMSEKSLESTEENNDESVKLESGGWKRQVGNFALFGSFFGALVTIVQRAAAETTLPHERIILLALAVILPDLARFSFSALTDSPSALRKARNPENITAEDFPRHALVCWLSTLFKLVGFYVAGTWKVAIGAFIAVFGQLLVNAFVQLRVINGTIFKLRRQDRTGVLLLEILSLGLVASSYLGVYPIMSAALFLSVVTVYWLAKYDVDLFGGL